MPGGIVVGTDGSPTADAAVIEAGRLAAAYRTHVTVVCAYGPRGPAALAVRDGAEQARRALALAAQRLEAAGVPHDERAVPGGAADAIIEIASRQAADTIVVGSRGMRGARRVLGSVPNSVSHRAPCSVLIVRTD